MGATKDVERLLWAVGEARRLRLADQGRPFPLRQRAPLVATAGGTARAVTEMDRRPRTPFP